VQQVTILAQPAAATVPDSAFCGCPCVAGTRARFIARQAKYPLPQPPQDPITQLKGHNHLNESGAPTCHWNVDYDETYTRTGD
jgi:hypothetical protein